MAEATDHLNVLLARTETPDANLAQVLARVNRWDPDQPDLLPTAPEALPAIDALAAHLHRLIDRVAHEAVRLPADAGLRRIAESCFAETRRRLNHRPNQGLCDDLVRHAARLSRSVDALRRVSRQIEATTR
ncbi:DUF6415 family natural product biosynthesis protein [Streptomyces kronopolitis]|uniref:DUF6415 family natural product biosynthesis protein n=1 Tax=Streptomyces kronopolitis TaxID=1612435 RepID=UPI0036A14D74